MRDYSVTDNQTHITPNVVSMSTGTDIPNDVMVTMDTTGNVTSRDVLITFSSQYMGLSDLPQVAEGFVLKYEYLEKGKRVIPGLHNLWNN